MRRGVRRIFLVIPGRPEGPNPESIILNNDGGKAVRAQR